WRLKWIFITGLSFGVLRYALCALDEKGWILFGVTLHGCSFTLMFITAQIYVDERMDRAWRARAQALLTLMMSGVGNLIGYLGTGWWFRACEQSNGVRWPLFWGGLAAAVAVVLIYFLIAITGVAKESQPLILFNAKPPGRTEFEPRMNADLIHAAAQARSASAFISVNSAVTLFRAREVSPFQSAFISGGQLVESLRENSRRRGRTLVWF